MSLHAWFDYNARTKSLDPQDTVDFEFTVEAVVLETPVELTDPLPQARMDAALFLEQA